MDIMLLLVTIFSIIWMSISGLKIKSPLIFRWIIAFWVIGLISLLFSMTVLPLPEVFKGSLYLMRFILYSLTFLIAYNLGKAKVLTAEGVIDVLILVGTILAALGFLQLIFYPNFDYPFFALTDFGYDPHHGRLAGVFLDPNFTGAHLSLTAGLVIYRLIGAKHKQKWLLLLIFLTLAIILTYSRSAWLMLASFIFILVAFLWKNFSRAQKFILPAAVVVTFLGVALLNPRFTQRLIGGLTVDQTARERLLSWQSGLAITDVNPFLGIGFNNLSFVKENLNLYRSSAFGNEHSSAGLDSSLLVVLTTTGIIGLIIYLIFWIQIFNGLLKVKNRIGVTLVALIIALFLNSQFINSLFFPPIMLWYFLVLGTLWASY